MTDQGPSLLHWEPTAEPSTAAVRVLVGRRGAHPVVPRLTGKFAEHLGQNIAQGMSAQILRNPTFAAAPFLSGVDRPDGGIAPECDERKIAEQIRRRAERLGLPDAERLVEAHRDHLADEWIRLGPRDAVRFSPDVGPHGGRAQRVELGAEGQGIAQHVHLPLHRVRQYEWRVVARAAEPTALRLRLTDAAGRREFAASGVDGVGRAWQTFTGRLELDASAPAEALYRLDLAAAAAGQFVVARVLLYPADRVGEADPDIIRLLRESHLPLLRWPGGNFASTDHWRDGVGPADQRPTRPNMAWGRVEPNLFGTDEFVAFCRQVGCEPMICINAGSGTPAEAADWVQYCNGPPDSPQGARRAANGHVEPYGIRLWEVGNELYGRWQMGWTTPAGYPDRFVAHAEAMRAADPSIELWGCGALNPPEWNRLLAERSAGLMAALTDHPLLGGRVGPGTEPLDVFRDFMAIPTLWGRKYEAVGEMMRAAGVAEPRLAITELQLFAHLETAANDSGPLTPETLVHPGTLAEALYDTLWFHMAARLAPFICAITHSAVVNHGGGLRKERERVYANPCHHVHALFAHLAGRTPVRVELSCPALASAGVLDGVSAGETIPRIDAFAAVGDDGELCVSLVNRGLEPVQHVEVTWEDFAPAGPAELWRLSASAPWEQNTVDAPDRIAPQREQLPCDDGRVIVSLPAFAMVQLRLPGQPGRQ